MSSKRGVDLSWLNDQLSEEGSINKLVAIKVASSPEEFFCKKVGHMGKVFSFPIDLKCKTFIAIDLTQKTSNLVPENVHQKTAIFNPLIFELMALNKIFFKLKGL